VFIQVFFASADVFFAVSEARMKVLIVEDSRFLRLSNERALQQAGYNVITAADGEEGLRLALERRPDLVILDLMLPKLPGHEVIRELRKHPQTSSIPVMVVTSLPQSSDRKVLEYGATAYFEKAGLLLDKGSELFVQNVRRMLSQSRAAAVR
jgi:CheY-like chemotaxis protein